MSFAVIFLNNDLIMMFLTFDLAVLFFRYFFLFTISLSEFESIGYKH